MPFARKIREDDPKGARPGGDGGAPVPTRGISCGPASSSRYGRRTGKHVDLVVSQTIQATALSTAIEIGHRRRLRIRRQGPASHSQTCKGAGRRRNVDFPAQFTGLNNSRLPLVAVRVQRSPRAGEHSPDPAARKNSNVAAFRASLARVAHGLGDCVTARRTVIVSITAAESARQYASRRGAGDKIRYPCPLARYGSKAVLPPCIPRTEFRGQIARVRSLGPLGRQTTHHHATTDVAAVGDGFELAVAV